jgi:hypothetical protein
MLSHQSDYCFVRIDDEARSDQKIEPKNRANKNEERQEKNIRPLPGGARFDNGVSAMSMYALSVIVVLGRESFELHLKTSHIELGGSIE